MLKDTPTDAEYFANRSPEFLQEMAEFYAEEESDDPGDDQSLYLFDPRLDSVDFQFDE